MRFECGPINISKVVLWVQLLDITSQSSKVLNIIYLDKGVRNRLCDCVRKSEINV